MNAPTALIAEDEDVLREELCAHLGALWPELRIVAQAGDGIEALRQAQALRPDVLFLDIQMPGLTGVEVAQRAGADQHVVFVTAYDAHAVAAFERGAPEQHAEAHLIAVGQRKLDRPGLFADPEQGPDDVTALDPAAGIAHRAFVDRTRLACHFRGFATLERMQLEFQP